MSLALNDALSNLHIKSLILKFKGDDQKIKELQRQIKVLKDYIKDLIEASEDYENCEDIYCANKLIPKKCEWLIWPNDCYSENCFLCTKIICGSCVGKYKCQECGFLICVNCGFNRNEHKRYLKWFGKSGKPKCTLCSNKKKNSKLITE